jgi:simple sugar transport system ATP-binding protein
MSRPVKDNLISTIVDKLVSRMGTMDESQVDKEAAHWVRRLNVNTKSIEAFASTLSGGNQQRLVLGRWLAAEPEILILNCPTVGVDVKSKSEIHKIIKELAAQGLTVLLISDDIGEILTTSNRVIVMNNGAMVFFGQTENTTHDELSRLITEIA